MHRSTSRFLIAAAMFCAGIGTANATLIDRGGGLIYDDVLDVTWMQDAQYAIASGYESSGRLSWSDAMAWAGGLQYYDPVRDSIWDDWRLPTTINDPSSLGYDTTGLSRELAFMYYVNLGYAPNYTHDRFSPIPTSENYNPFLNLAYRAYWSSTLGDSGGEAWALHFHFGSQELGGIGDGSRVWLVRDGDVADHSVPEPGSLALMGLGLLGLGLARHRTTTASASGELPHFNRRGDEFPTTAP